MAILSFERGDAQRPTGHAFLYFGSGEEVYTTYIVVAPVTFDISKYIPPFLASSIGSMGMLGFQASFLAVPPIPERFALAELRRAAEWRGDDIIADGMVMGGGDPTVLAARVAELADAYSTAYHEARDRAPLAAPAESPASSDNTEGLALLYSVLPERERMAEMAKRLGTLRYALEVKDGGLVETTCAEMRAIGAFLPEIYRTRDLISAARRPDAEGARLAQLYVERGYKLSAADQEGVPALDAEIESLERHHA